MARKGLLLRTTTIPLPAAKINSLGAFLQKSPRFELALPFTAGRRAPQNDLGGGTLLQAAGCQGQVRAVPVGLRRLVDGLFAVDIGRQLGWFRQGPGHHAAIHVLRRPMMSA